LLFVVAAAARKLQQLNGNTQRKWQAAVASPFFHSLSLSASLCHSYFKQSIKAIAVQTKAYTLIIIVVCQGSPAGHKDSQDRQS